MAIRLEKKLKFWTDCQVQAMMSRDHDVDRPAVVLAVLEDFVQSCNAERYLRRDGQIGWRATASFHEQIREGEIEANEHNA
jgi:hypothetical protein